MESDVFAFSATEIGHNHLKSNKVCEDASAFENEEKIHIGVVADGHGSDNYPRTDRGALFAVGASIKCIHEFINCADAQQVIEDKEHGYILLTQLAKSILREWYQAVEDDYRNHPFEEIELENVSEKYRKRYLAEDGSECHKEKAYGCTLIAYAITESYSFGLQIGDGKCVLINAEGDFTEPIPWDDNCQMNVTTSICDSDAIEEFRFYISDNAPAAVFCGTDGIDDSYTNREELYALYRSIIKIFTEYGIDVGKSEIKEYLPILTKRGSGDDVSLAIVVNMKKIMELAPIFEIQTSLFNCTAALELKKKKFAITGEKMDAQYKNIRNCLFSNGEQTSSEELHSLISLYDQLAKEIGTDEQKINDLQSQLEELLSNLKTLPIENSEEEEKTEGNAEPVENVESEKAELEDVSEINNQVVITDAQFVEDETYAVENQTEEISTEKQTLKTVDSAPEVNITNETEVLITENFAE